jgi:hypothetical protein
MLTCLINATTECRVQRPRLTLLTVTWKTGQVLRVLMSLMLMLRILQRDTAHGGKERN